MGSEWWVRELKRIGWQVSSSLSVRNDRPVTRVMAHSGKWSVEVIYGRVARAGNHSLRGVGVELWHETEYPRRNWTGVKESQISIAFIPELPTCVGINFADPVLKMWGLK